MSILSNMHLKTIVKGLIAGFLILVFTILVVKIYRSQISQEREMASKEVGDFERLTHVNTLVSAVAAYRNDHAGELPGPIGSDGKYICRSEVYSDCTDLVDLRPLLKSYILAFPSDPSAPIGANTYYLIKVDDKGQIIVSAPRSETKPISATR